VALVPLVPLSLCVLALSSGCSTPPAAAGPDLALARATGLLHDELYAVASEPAEAADVFALSEPMRAYADARIGKASPLQDPRRSLIDALYKRDELRLRYDAGATRNAAQAFEARAGNCLSLVIMTAAFARHLGLSVAYQSVQVEETYSRSGELMFTEGHVNLVLGGPAPRSSMPMSLEPAFTVDFLPGADLRGARTSPLQEATIVAMYHNNRAAEALAEGRTDEAYRSARRAVLRDPSFVPALNTLAVVYLRSGHLQQALEALRLALEREPESTLALSNEVLVLQRQGRAPEALAVARKLAQIEPVPPFHDFDLGRKAMGAGDFGEARDRFARELRRQPYQSEVHFWAALADWQLGDGRRATQHLRLAMENSNTRAAHDLYAAKLERLRALQLQ
jgi:tetratricopeptide (TPR) repeat protein